jgi:hypothetical protein
MTRTPGIRYGRATTKPPRTMSAIAVAVAAVAVLVGGTAWAGRATPGAKTLHYTVHFSPFTLIDVGAKGASLGDEIVSHDMVFSLAGKRVGYDAQTCTVTNLRPLQASCSLIFAIPGGTIAGQYIGSPPPHKLVAMTGGTGTTLARPDRSSWSRVVTT